MDVHPLRVPDLDRLTAAGNARLISRGPRTVTQVLEAARQAMDDEDELERYRNDPVAWLRAHRPRTLLSRLLWKGR